MPVGGAGAYLFRQLRGTWRTVSDAGIVAAGRNVLALDILPLDTELALDFAQRFEEEADLAATRLDAEATRQWAAWARELSDYAHGRGTEWRTGSKPMRRNPVHHDDQAVSFTAMTRRARR